MYVPARLDHVTYRTRTDATGTEWTMPLDQLAEFEPNEAFFDEENTPVVEMRAWGDIWGAHFITPEMTDPGFEIARFSHAPGEITFASAPREWWDYQTARLRLRVVVRTLDGTPACWTIRTAGRPEITWDRLRTGFEQMMENPSTAQVRRARRMNVDPRQIDVATYLLAAEIGGRVGEVARSVQSRQGIGRGEFADPVREFLSRAEIPGGADLSLDYTH